MRQNSVASLAPFVELNRCLTLPKDPPFFSSESRVGTAAVELDRKKKPSSFRKQTASFCINPNSLSYYSNLPNKRTGMLAEF